METTDIVRMSSKGQLVVPQAVRELAELNPGEMFAAIAVKDGVLFKRVDIPKISAEFEILSDAVQKQFSRNKVTKSDVDKAVRSSR